MNTKIVSLWAYLVFALVFLTQQEAFAGTGGREKARFASHMYHLYVQALANTSYTIETLNLSSGADTVLHVQDASGGFVAGNDDYLFSPRSLVTIPSSSQLRGLRIFVRAYSLLSAGTATLRITPSGGIPADYSIRFQSGYKKTFSSFRSGTHFFTVQEQGGTSDTIMLVTSGGTSRAIAYNDDSTVGSMSWIHANEDCSSGCSVLVGSYSQAGEGNTTFIWDEDFHVSGQDRDNDYMSDALENAIGTNPGKFDTDGDGIDDGTEVMGIGGPDWHLLRFPYFGADPLVPDIFIEADWQKCIPEDMTDFSCGDPTNPISDLYLLPSSQVAVLAAQYAPDFTVHVDNGVKNTDPATWFQSGDWGGASRFVSANSDKCQHLSQARRGYFHGARMRNEAQSQEPGNCFDVVPRGRVMAHELGHNFNLSHGGKQSNSWDINCKPSYPSIMSYAGLNGSSLKLSRGTLSSLSLNPVQMNEMSGIGTTDQEILSWLKGENFQYEISPTGAIDWNRDGRYSSGTVRAAASWGWGSGGCDQSGYLRDEGPTHGSFSALSWLPGSGTETPLLFWFTRSASYHRYRTATTLPTNCGSPPSATCKTNWTPARENEGTAVPGSLLAEGAPSATWYYDSVAGEYRLIVVMRFVNNRIESRTYSRQTGWSSLSTVKTSSDVITGDLAVWRCPRTQREVCVYAPIGNRLRMWRRDQNGTWMAPVDQVWDDATFIEPAFGIALTEGRHYSSSGISSLAQTFAAIPLATSNPVGVIELAWTYDGSSWSRLDASAWIKGRAVTTAQPGLAYEPFDPNDYNQGRFYLSWSPSDAGKYIAQTEGNDWAGSVTTGRRFQWRQEPAYLTNKWLKGPGNISLLFERGIDTNMRGAITYLDNYKGGPVPQFFPFADGIFNGVMRDQNDIAVVQANMTCSLNNSACPM